MNDLLYLGQWQGFFQYGSEYGDIISGKEAEFRLFIEKYTEGRFTGKIIDWEGLGANGEVAQVQGFVSGEFISFTKQYDQSHAFDEWGNTKVIPDIPGHKVVYEGSFFPQSSSFVGTWEIIVEIEHTPNHTIEEVATGTWYMKRQQ